MNKKSPDVEIFFQKGSSMTFVGCNPLFIRKINRAFKKKKRLCLFRSRLGTRRVSIDFAQVYYIEVTYHE